MKLFFRRRRVVTIVHYSQSRFEKRSKSKFNLLSQLSTLITRARAYAIPEPFAKSRLVVLTPVSLEIALQFCTRFQNFEVAVAIVAATALSFYFTCHPDVITLRATLQ